MGRKTTTAAAASGASGAEPVVEMLEWAQRLLGVTGSLMLTLGDPAQPQRTFTQDADAQAADGLQWLAQQGPTFEAYTTSALVCSDDLSTEGRWPRLRQVLITHRPSGSSRALSVIAAPVGSVAVLTAYSCIPGCFTADGLGSRFRSAADAFSQLLSMRQRVVDAEVQVSTMQVALRTRAPIEQAKGVLAARLDTSVEEAFDVMARVSQDRNVKLRDLATLLASDPGSAALDDVLR